MTATRDAAPGWEFAAIEALMRPRSVAIVGVSSRADAAGNLVLENLVLNEFAGDIHLVGRNATTIEGRACLAGIDELPENVDLAVLAIPAAGVAEAVAACVRRKVKSAITFASGFAEMGEDERARQQEIGAMAQAGRLALVGPNCLGYTNYVDGFTIGFMRFPKVPRLTRGAGIAVIAVIAQSGGIGGHIASALEARNATISHMITVGNEAGIGVAELIDYLARDAHTAIITVYCEQIRRPAAFLAAVAAARARGKPVVMIHPGRSERSQAAARSHTGALAGDHAAMRVAVTRAGVALVETLEELIDVAEILLRYSEPPCAGVGVLTFSGALCAIAQDYCATLGLDLPPLSSEQKDKLRPSLAIYNPPDNPLDLGTTSAWQPDLVRLGAEALLADPKLGSLIVSIPPGGPGLGVKWLDRIRAASRGSTKPLVVVFQNDGAALAPEVMAAVRENRMILMRSPERAFRAVARLTAYGNDLAAATSAVAPLPLGGLPPLGPGTQPEWRGKQVLSAIGIAIPAGGLARSPEEACEIAQRIGYPVAIKAQAASLAHKSEVGGVILGIADEASLRQSWQTLVANLARARPGLTLDGVLIEAMGAPGLELVVGARRDPHWGPILLIGLGGIWIEALGDVRLLPPDLPEAAIVAEIDKLKASRLLHGFRGAEAVDVAAVARTASLIGRLMQAMPEIAELDINPLVAHAAGQGVTALDALVVCRSASVMDRSRDGDRAWPR